MSQSSVELVSEVIRKYLEEHELPQVEIKPDSRVLGELPLDSLALAVIVVELEERTGKDPFKKGFIRFNTVGELAKLYDNA